MTDLDKNMIIDGLMNKKGMEKRTSQKEINLLKTISSKINIYYVLLRY